MGGFLGGLSRRWVGFGSWMMDGKIGGRMGKVYIERYGGVFYDQATHECSRMKNASDTECKN